MKFDFGTIVVVVVVLLFYLRLILLQRAKSKRLRDLETIIPKPKKAQPVNTRASAAEVMRFRFANLSLSILAIVLMVAGALLVAFTGLDPQLRAWWWVPVSAGVILFGFMIR